MRPRRHARRPFSSAACRARLTASIALAAACVGATAAAHAGAVNFAEPAGWTVGDLNSTHQQWVADPLNPFASANTPPTSTAASPTLAASATMGVSPPGFVAGSGGYYSFGGDYGVYAKVSNHDGPSGAGGPYPHDFGTRVVIQTASTMNGANSVFPSSVEIVAPDGSELVGGCNSCMIQSRELFVGNVETSIGIVPQQELSFEFWLPKHTADFRVEFDVVAHSSFQHLRIDSHIEAPPPIDPDFDGNEIIDGADLLAWQRCPPVRGEAQAFAAWKLGFGVSPVAPTSASAPEPTSLGLIIPALFGVASRLRRTTVRPSRRRPQT